MTRSRPVLLMTLMSSALGPTMADFSQLILDLDPARVSWQQLADSAKDRAEALRAQMERLREQLAARIAEEGAESRAARLAAAVDRASEALAELQDALSQKTDPARWRTLYAQLAASYEQMRKIGTHVPGADPKVARISRQNLPRALFHVGSGLFAALLYHFVLTREQALLVIGPLVVAFLGLEVGRRRWPALNDWLMRSPAIRATARPHEYYRINSATWFGIGLLVAAITSPKLAVELGCVVLAIADPVASTLGRRFGRVKLYRDKSWVGTLAFFGAAFGASALYVSLLAPAAGAPWLIAAVAAATGAVAELFSTRLDDNLTIPLTVAVMVGLLAM